MPYWENLFPDAARRRPRAPRRRWRDVQHRRARLHHGALRHRRVLLLRRAASTGRSRTSRRSTTRSRRQSTIGRSNYNALHADAAQAVQRRLPVRRELHVRRIEGQAPTSSAAARSDFATGGYTGFLINSLDPDSQLRHVGLRRPAPGEPELDLRTCRSARARSSAARRGLREPVHRRLVDRRADALDERLPVQRPQLPVLLADQLEPAGQRQPRDPACCRRPETTKNAVDGRSEPVRGSGGRAATLPRSLPGEVGLRNVLRGDGYFTRRHQREQGVDGASPTTGCASGGTSST